MSVEDHTRAAVALDQRFEPLAALFRGGAVESVHRGLLVVADGVGRLWGGVGDPAAPVHLRSAAKPFQALAVVESGAVDAFGVTPEELAVMTGSHAGQAEHVRAVRSLLARAGVTEEALVCGAPAHMCSGKHAGMILLARHVGAPVEGYEAPTHPVQREIAATVGRLLARGAAADAEALCGADATVAGAAGLAGAGPLVAGGAASFADVLFAGIDGCGVPVLRLPAGQVAWLFAQLAAGASAGLARVRDAMLAHPDMVAGRSRLDTRIMKAVPGRVLAKGGAEGVQALALCATGGEGAVLGCVIKVEDGSTRPLPALVGLCLQRWGLELPPEALEQTLPRDEWTTRSLAPGELRVLVDPALVGTPATPQVGAQALVADGASAAGVGAAVGVAAGVARRFGSGPGWNLSPGPEKLDLIVGHGDEKELVRFLREEWPLSDEEVFGRQTQWIADPFALILKQKRRVLGVLKGHFLGGLASIDEFIVGHEHRGDGLGAQLLARFEDEARQRGCTRVVLRAVKGGRAEHFYRRHGYETECVQLDYEFGEDFIRLTHRLRPGGGEE